MPGFGFAFSIKVVPVANGVWKPQTILRYVESIPTSTRVVRVETDQGEGFLKALGNPEGPHVLACELVGTLLAEWMGIPNARQMQSSS